MLSNRSIYPAAAPCRVRRGKFERLIFTYSILRLYATRSAKSEKVVIIMEQKLIYICSQGENVKHGIYFNDARMTESFGLHCHDFHELEIVTAGKCLECVNGVSINISKGDVYVLTPSDIHSFILDKSSEPLEILSVRFYENDIHGSLGDCLKKITMPIIPRISAKEYELILTLATAARADIASARPELAASAVLMLEAVLHRLLSAENEYVSCGTTENSYAQAAIAFISQNYMNDIGLPDVAEHLAISKCYLSTIMTKTFSKSFRDILNVYRLRSARNLLLSTDKSVTTICYECGYQNFAHFSRVFKNTVGVSPGEYRRSNWRDKTE